MNRIRADCLSECVGSNWFSSLTAGHAIRYDEHAKCGGRALILNEITHLESIFGSAFGSGNEVRLRFHLPFDSKGVSVPRSQTSTSGSW